MKVKFLLTLFVISLGFYSCAGLEKSEKNRIRKLNARKEAIYRKHSEVFFQIDQPKKRSVEPYFWENKIAGNIQAITKEYFRCKGSISNPPVMLNEKTSNEKYHYDCGGFDEHSLPVKEEKEFVFPALVEILNYVQKKAMKKVVITCAYRCPKHNLYAESQATKSKHLVGAEVDFYVQGLEYNPKEVISILKQYYEEKVAQFGLLQSKSALDTVTYENKEVKVSLFKEDEKRDFDNRHPYPYISIELKYDRDTKKSVFYNWHQSHQTVMKW